MKSATKLSPAAQLIVSLSRQLDALCLSGAHREDIEAVRARLVAAKAAK